MRTVLDCFDQTLKPVNENVWTNHTSIIIHQQGPAFQEPYVDDIGHGPSFQSLKTRNPSFQGLVIILLLFDGHFEMRTILDKHQNRSNMIKLLSLVISHAPLYSMEYPPLPMVAIITD